MNLNDVVKKLNKVAGEKAYRRLFANTIEHKACGERIEVRLNQQWGAKDTATIVGQRAYRYALPAQIPALHKAVTRVAKAEAAMLADRRKTEAHFRGVAERLVDPFMRGIKAKRVKSAPTDSEQTFRLPNGIEIDVMLPGESDRDGATEVCDVRFPKRMEKNAARLAYGLSRIGIP
jgi:hypothetical protein